MQNKTIFLIVLLFFAVPYLFVGNAHAAEYDFFINTFEHGQGSNARIGIGIQKGIVDAFRAGIGLLPLLIIIIVLSLVMWAQRIADKGDVFHFLGWLTLSFFLFYSTFGERVDLAFYEYTWEQAGDKGELVTSLPQSKLSDVPAINAFLVSTTGLSRMITHIIMKSVNITPAELKYCSSPLDWYSNAYRGLITKARDTKDEETLTYRTAAGGLVKNSQMFAKEVLASLKYRLYSGFNVITPFMDSTIQSGEFTGKFFPEMLLTQIEKCENSLTGADADIEQQRKKLLSMRRGDVFSNPIALRFAEQLKKVEIASPADLSGKVTENMGVFSNSIQNLMSGIATIFAQVQPRLIYTLKIIFYIQGILTAFLFVAAPFVVLYATIPITGDIGINFKVLFLYFLSFFMVQSWYPALMFLKVVLYGNIVK
jgi:hypothetical protein